MQPHLFALPDKHPAPKKKIPTDVVVVGLYDGVFVILAQAPIYDSPGEKKPFFVKHKLGKLPALEALAIASAIKSKDQQSITTILV